MLRDALSTQSFLRRLIQCSVLGLIVIVPALNICMGHLSTYGTPVVVLSRTRPAAKYKSPFRSKKNGESVRAVIHRVIEKNPEDDRPTVTEDRCIGYGRCEEKCPQPEKAIRVEVKRKIIV